MKLSCIPPFIDPTAITGLIYVKPNIPVKLTNVECTGSEKSIDDCQATQLSPDESQVTYAHISAAGVKCVSETTTGPLEVIKNNSATIGLGFLIICLVNLFSSLLGKIKNLYDQKI